MSRSLSPSSRSRVHAAQPRMPRSAIQSTLGVSTRNQRRGARVSCRHYLSCVKFRPRNFLHLSATTNPLLQNPAMHGLASFHGHFGPRNRPLPCNTSPAVKSAGATPTPPAPQSRQPQSCARSYGAIKGGAFSNGSCTDVASLGGRKFAGRGSLPTLSTRPTARSGNSFNSISEWALRRSPVGQSELVIPPVGADRTPFTQPRPIKHRHPYGNAGAARSSLSDCHIKRAAHQELAVTHLNWRSRANPVEGHMTFVHLFERAFDRNHFTWRD